MTVSFPAATFQDTEVLVNHFSPKSADTPDLHVLATWGPVADPPVLSALLCRTLTDYAIGHCSCGGSAQQTRMAAYRGALDELDTTDPGVLVVAHTLLQVAVLHPRADTDLFVRLSPDYPVVVRASAAAVDAMGRSVAHLCHREPYDIASDIHNITNPAAV